jgi:H+-transporting ATPase
LQPYGKLVTMIYMKVSLSDFLTLFAARTEGFVFSIRPGEEVVCWEAWLVV